MWGLRRRARIVCWTLEVVATRLGVKSMIHRKNREGQSLLEYAMVAAVVAAAVIAMSTYVFRSVQATQQTIQTEFQKE